MENNGNYPAPEAAAKPKKGNLLTKILGTLFALLLIVIAVALAGTDLMSSVLLVVAAVLVSPVTTMLTKNKGKFFSFLRFVAFTVAFVASISTYSDPQSPETTRLSVDEAYQQLVAEAGEGDYLEGWRVYQNYPELEAHGDAKKYNEYCIAMRAYQAGAIGYAYNIFLTVPDILDAQTYINSIGKELSFFNGVFKEDNGQGSYLYLVLENGLALTELVGYADDSAGFTYDMSTAYNSIVKGSYNDGKAFYAIGSYNPLGAKVKVNYVMEPFEAERQIMVIRYDGYEYTTFNGLYDKIR